MHAQLTLPLRADLCSGDWQGPFEVVAEYRDGNGTPLVDLGRRVGDQVRVIVQGVVLGVFESRSYLDRDRMPVVDLACTVDGEQRTLATGVVWGSAARRATVVSTTERAGLVVSASELKCSVEANSASGFLPEPSWNETAGEDRESRLASEITDTPARPVVLKNDRSRILVAIDWNNLLHRSWHAAQNAPHKALWGTLKFVVDQFTGCSIVLADEGGDSFRKQFDAGYKAHRKPLDDGLRLFRDQAKAVCEAIGWRFISVATFEADDVLASLATQLIETNAAPHVVVVTSDKDLQQLVGQKRVTVYCPYGEKRGRVETWDVEERWGVPPSQLGDLLALVGDKSDGVPGVEGVGPVTAAEWLTQHKTLAAIETYASQMACSKKCSKSLQALARSGERLASIT